MFIAALFLFSVFAAQLLRIQAFDASATQAAALSKRLIKLHTPAMRGQILDTNGQVLADSVERFTIAADPVAIQCYVKVQGECGWQGVHQAAADLAPKLGLDVARLTTLFTKPNTRTSSSRRTSLRATGGRSRPSASPGSRQNARPSASIRPRWRWASSSATSTRRTRPQGAASSSCSMGRWQAGQARRSQSGRRTAPSSPALSGSTNQRWMGRNVRLTIDSDIQWYAQNALAKQVTAVKAETGTAIVLELATGYIRAAAELPDVRSQ